MIPLRSSERTYSPAIVTGVLIALNTAILLYEETLSRSGLERFVFQWGIVPDRLHLSSLFTSMFLHAGWFHLLGNMLYLWVFGRNVEDLIGSGRYLVFYILCGLCAAVVHIIFNPFSPAPTIGASGAIAGVLGAYLVKFPRSRIVSLVFFFIFITTVDIPAAVLLIIWFAMNFFSGVGSLGETDYTGGGTAYFAHIGGFVAGMLLIRLFPPKRRWRAWYEAE